MKSFLNTSIFMVIFCSSLHSIWAGSFSESYLLGRFTGGYYPEMNWNIAKNDSISQNLQWRAGIKQQFEWFANFKLHNTDSSERQQLNFEKVGMNLRFAPGWRIKLDLQSDDFWWEMGGDQQDGLGDDPPWILENSISLEHLTRRGKISLTPEYYNLAFYDGPLLNKGQIHWGLELADALFPNFITQKGNLYFELGVANQWNLGMSLKNERLPRQVVSFKPKTSKYEYVDANGRIRTHTDTVGTSQSWGWEKNIPWSQNLSLYSSKSFSRLKLGAEISIDGPDSTKLAQGELHWGTDWSILLGKRNLKFSQVTANWNQQFSHTIAPGQVLWKGQIQDSLINQSVLFGVFKNFSHQASYQYHNSRHRAFLRLNYSNRELLPSGPDRVTPMDYLYGSIHQPGELTFKLSYKIPLDGADKDIYGSYMEHLSLDPIFAPKNPLEGIFTLGLPYSLNIQTQAGINLHKNEEWMGMANLTWIHDDWRSILGYKYLNNLQEESVFFLNIQTHF